MIELRVIDDPDEARALSPRWRALLDRASTPEPALTPLWILSWWRVFGEETRRTMKLAVFFEDRELVGLAPLLSRWAVYRHALPYRRLEVIGTGEDEADEVCSDYTGVLAARGFETRVTEALARGLMGGMLQPWDEVLFANMSAEGGVSPGGLLDALRAEGARVTLAPAGVCPYVPLPPSWGEYLGRLDGSRRYALTRSLRELEGWAGPHGPEVKRAGNPSELAEGVRILRALHTERWASKGRPGVFASTRFTRFHEAVMPALLDGVDGALDLLWLVVRGEPVAVVYNIVFRGKVYFYQSGRRVDVPKGVKPGIALHALALKRSIEAGRREYDFLKGASRYKREFALAERPLVTVRAVAPTVRARTLEGCREMAERAAVQARRVAPA